MSQQDNRLPQGGRIDRTKPLRFTFDGKVYKIPPTTIRPQARHKGDLTTRIKAAFTTEASARMAAENGLGQMFVAGAGLDEMTAQVS